MRYAAKRDTAEPAIVEALEKVGALVIRMNQPCDLLVRYNAVNYLMEVKTLGTYPDARQKAQRDFLHAFAVPIVKTPLEALTAIGVICG
jgi:hypothetical protein